MKAKLGLQSEMDLLRDIFNNTFNVDVLNRLRKREMVEARMMFSKILRERGYGLAVIGGFLNKDHTTIMHYLTEIENILKFGSVQKSEMYMACRVAFLEGKEELVHEIKYKHAGITIRNLNSRIDGLILERKDVLEREKKTKRFKKIIKLLDKRIPIGAESQFERKLLMILNGDI